MTELKNAVKVIGNFNLKPPFKKLYPIYWLIYPESSDKAYGICGYSNRAFAVSSPNNWVKLTTVTSLVIDNDECQESERCLVVSCKYNKTTIETYAKAFDLSARKLQKLWDRLICNVTAISESAERIYQDYQKKNC